MERLFLFMGYNTKEFKNELNKEKDDFVNKNFLLVSLEERKAKKIAEVINNDTSRKIIDYLAKKDATESELSKELKIPLSTIHYNIRQLQEAGLVVVEEFHYSKKGKEINHYTLANKYIIIAPLNQDSKFLEALKKILPLTIITATVAFIMQLFNSLTLRNNKLMSTESIIMEQTTTESAKLMASPIAQDITISTFQLTPATYFLVGGIAVIIIYFIYEISKKR